jgi:DNA mismatch repair ATPase MutS
LNDCLLFLLLLLLCACSPYVSLHTRIGTSDSIESNASSFMVEMADMARLMTR